jgi:hypothetical protein
VPIILDELLLLEVVVRTGGSVMRLPPHNQRRLNVAIREHLGDRYSDWFDLARELQETGATYETIAQRFTALGVKVSLYTVRDWMLARRTEATAARAA